APAIFDHEMFHLVDYRLHGAAQRQPAWDALNPATVSYVGIERYSKDPRAHEASGSIAAHFVSRYAQASAIEDRAETFRVLMSDPKLAAKQRASDSVIDAKARYIIDALDQLATGSSVALG